MRWLGRLLCDIDLGSRVSGMEEKSVVGDFLPGFVWEIPFSGGDRNFASDLPIMPTYLVQ